MVLCSILQHQIDGSGLFLITKTLYKIYRVSTHYEKKIEVRKI